MALQNHISKIVLIILALTFSAIATAGIDKYVPLNGKVYLFDKKQVVIQDAAGTRWRIPRELFFVDAGFRTGDQLKVLVLPGDITKYEPQKLKN